MSWYAEPLPALGQCLAGFKNAGVDHVVAVDGRYELFPGDAHWSGEDEHAAVVGMCRHLGMGCTLHLPAGAWGGNEVQKRTHLFMLALAESDPGDWMLLQDADEVIVRAPADLKDRLDATEHEVGLITCRDMNIAAMKEQMPEAVPPHAPEYFGVRKLFRSQPICVTTNHHTYVTLDGRILWAAAGEQNEETPALDLRAEMEMHHRPGVRDEHRNDAKFTYYTERDESRVEAGACRWVEDRKSGKRCGRLSARRVRFDPRKTATGVACSTAEMCEKHAEQAERRLVGWLRREGFLCFCGVRTRRGPDDICQECHRPVKFGKAFQWVDQLDPAPVDRPALEVMSAERAAAVAARVVASANGR